MCRGRVFNLSILQQGQVCRTYTDLQIGLCTISDLLLPLGDVLGSAVDTVHSLRNTALLALLLLRWLALGCSAT